MSQKGFISTFAIVGVLVIALTIGSVYFLSIRGRFGIKNTDTKTTNFSESTIELLPSSSLSSNANWSKAETRWNVFIQEHIERMRIIDSKTPAAKLPNYKFDRQSLEITHSLISKYLTNNRIFTDRYFTFVLRNDGHIIVIGTTLPGNSAYKSAPDLEVLEYSNFIKNMELSISDNQTAIEMVKLKTIVNGNGYAKDSDWDSWEFKASQNANKWIVNLRYVGDLGASIMMPSSWEISVNEKNSITGIKELYPDFPSQPTQQERDAARKRPKSQCGCWDAIQNICLPQGDCI